MNGTGWTWVIGWLMVAGPGMFIVAVIACLARRRDRREAAAREEARLAAEADWLASPAGEQWYATESAGEPS